jgi:hypothetical protein
MLGCAEVRATEIAPSARKGGGVEAAEATSALSGRGEALQHCSWVGIVLWPQLIAQQAASAVCVAAKAQPNAAWRAIARVKAAISALRIVAEASHQRRPSQLNYFRGSGSGIASPSFRESEAP